MTDSSHSALLCSCFTLSHRDMVEQGTAELFRGTFPDVSCHYVQFSGPGRNSKTRSVLGNWSLMMSSSNLSRCLARGGNKEQFHQELQRCA